MNRFSIDIETLGTNVCDTILSVGICKFNLLGEILSTLEVTFDIEENKSMACTKGTIVFWLMQAKENFGAVEHVFFNDDAVNLMLGLQNIREYIGVEHCEMWANGTKFDLGMVERLFLDNDLAVPWLYNSDRCMRTLRSMYGNIEIDMGEHTQIAHTNVFSQY